MKPVFSIPVRVYYEDTDAEGLVYYANYLKFAERARTEFLRAYHAPLEGLQDGERCAFVVRHAEIDYKNSAFLDNLLTVSCEVVELRTSSVVIKQEIKREDEVLCVLLITLVYININRHRPTRIPDNLRTLLA